MAKKNNKVKINPQQIFWWIMLAILVMFVLYFATGFDPFGIISAIVALLKTLFTLIGFSVGGLGVDGATPTGDLPVDDLRCTDYDINNEYRDFFTNTVINAARTNCEAGGATWVENNEQISCFLGAPAVVDCDGTFHQFSIDLCESMNAEPVCDNTIGLYGCFCLQGGANIPEIEDDEEPQDQGGDDDDEEHGDFEIPIFVTANQWNGAMGGLAGADQKCTVSANFAGLPGSWKAIMSDSGTDAFDRVPSPRTPHRYVRLDGVKIADNRADLFDGSIDAPINLNEHLELVNGKVWAGSTVIGTNSGNNCHDWGWVNEVGLYGTSLATDVNWIDTAGQDCSNSARIYCVWNL